jgi:hypothetical protein
MWRAATIILASLGLAAFAPATKAAAPPKAAASPEVLEKMKPLDTLLQVEELLKSGNIPFQWQRATFDPSKMDPQLLAQIQALPTGAVFILPGPDRVFINRIIGRATSGPAAPSP